MLWPLLAAAAGVPGLGAAPAFLDASSALVLWSGRTVPGDTSSSVAFDYIGVSARIAVSAEATWVTVAAYSNGTAGTRLRTYTSDQGFDSYPLAAVFVPPRGSPFGEPVIYSGEPVANVTTGARVLTVENMLGAGPGTGVTTVYGFRTDGAFVAPPPTHPGTPRRIEFVGDSITAATNLVRPAGAPPCRGNAVQQDYSLSYQSRICRHFGASCSTVAVGGRCMMRECGGLQMPDYYNSALQAQAPAPTYGFGDGGGWKPDAVFVALGTNDERAIHGHPGRNESFADQYVAFLVSVAARYADSGIKFFVAGGPIRNFTARSTRALPVVVARAAAAGLDATFVDLTGACALGRLHAPDDADLCDGCSAHPGVEGHYQMYLRAREVVAGKMGWGPP